MEEDFDPHKLDSRGGNRPALIPLDSPEAQILADGIESGLSINKTWKNINWHRKESGQEMICESSVYTALRKMQPKIEQISKRKQGSTDPSMPWCRARKEWCRQLLVRFGILGDTEFQHPIERRFCRQEIGHLDLSQVVWWDETHRKCLIGGLSATKDYYFKFPRDKEGQLDLEKGQY